MIESPKSIISGPKKNGTRGRPAQGKESVISELLSKITSAKSLMPPIPEVDLRALNVHEKIARFYQICDRRKISQNRDIKP